jgi:hypothetical protein
MEDFFLTGNTQSNLLLFVKKVQIQWSFFELHRLPTGSTSLRKESQVLAKMHFLLNGKGAFMKHVTHPTL